MSINELQDEVIAEFSDFDDWMDAINYLLTWEMSRNHLKKKYKTEQKSD